MGEKKKICVQFPGMGYTNLKPLLYYSGKMALGRDYELKQILYSNMPPKVGQDPVLLKQAFDLALDQSREQLSKVKWDDYDEVLFIGKSVGTAVMTALGKELESEVNIRYIYFTPLAQTYIFVEESSGIAFHGNNDPWADTSEIKELSENKDIPLYIYEGGNHSLETGNVIRDVEIIGEVMAILEDFIK